MSLNYFTYIGEILWWEKLLKVDIPHFLIDFLPSFLTLFPPSLHFLSGFLNHDYLIFSCLPYSSNTAIHQHSYAILFYILTILYLVDVVYSFQGFIYLLIPLLHVFIGFHPHKGIFLEMSYASDEEVSFPCEFCIHFSEFTLQEYHPMC